MKIIITEEQHRLIIESEGMDKLFAVPTDLLEMSGGVTKALNLYHKLKDSKGWDGIKVVGKLDYYQIDTDVYDDMVNLTNEIVYINGTLILSSENPDNNFGKLKAINGNLRGSEVDNISFPNLEYVTGDVSLEDSGISELPKLKKVEGALFLQRTGIRSLPELEYVGLHLNLYDTRINDLPKLKIVQGVLGLKHSRLADKTTEEELRKQINIGGSIHL
jgi:hypothetical protein